MASPDTSHSPGGRDADRPGRPAGRSVRQPAVAGLFYPHDPVECSTLAKSLLRPAGDRTAPTDWRGAVVPHAGWVCSGMIAGEAIATLARRIRRPDVVVVFGAIHTALEAPAAMLSSHDLWQEPGGDSQVAVEVGAG